MGVRYLCGVAGARDCGCGCWPFVDLDGDGDDDDDGVCSAEDEGEGVCNGCGICGEGQSGTDVVCVSAA